MKNVQGVMLPDGDTAFTQAAHYQREKRNEALKWVKQRRTYVDVGAHCGLWAMHLTKLFQRTEAFEPVKHHCDLFKINVGGNYTLHNVALGDESKSVSMNVGIENSGHTLVDGEGNIPMKRLDDYELPEVDFIKVDCEGYELLVLKGAAETLKFWKPCVIVEQKPGAAKHFGLPDLGAVEYLKSLGAKLRGSSHGDYILSWD